MADSVPGRGYTDIDIGYHDDSDDDKEDVTEVHCDPCKDYGEYNKKAKGYCVDCHHYLCRTCFQYHCKPKPSRHHRLLDESEMPHIQPVKHVFNEFCQSHQGEQVKFYCKIHEKIGCHSCMLNDHEECKEIVSLAEIAAGLEHSVSLQDLQAWVHQSEKDIGDMITRVQLNIQTNKSCSNRAMVSIEKYQKEINDKFERLKESIIREVKNTESEDSRTIVAVEDSVKSAETELGEMKLDIQNLFALKSTKQNTQLFVALKQVQKRKEHLQSMLTKVKEENTIIRKYEFIENEHLTNSLKNTDNIGELCYEDSSNNNYTSSYSNYPEYGVQKCVALSETECVIADHINNNIEIIEGSTLVQKCHLSSGPWDITVIGEHKIAVTLPNEKQIKILSISKSGIEESQSIAMDAKCEGIAYAQNCLLVACTKPPKLTILNMHGHVLRNIETSDIGLPLFKQPAYIAYNDEKHLICVTDRQKKRLTVITMAGDIIDEYNTNLKMPLYVAIDNETALVYDPLYSQKCIINLDTGSTENKDFEQDMVVRVGFAKESSLNNSKYASMVVMVCTEVDLNFKKIMY